MTRKLVAVAVLATLSLPVQANADPSQTFSVRFGHIKCLPDGNSQLKIVVENGHGILHWTSSIPTSEGRYVRQKFGSMSLSSDRTVKRLVIKRHKALYVKVFYDDVTFLSGTRLAKECKKNV